jgi:hypothetical protein
VAEANRAFISQSLSKFMPTSHLADQAIAALQQAGFEIRYDHLGGDGSGHCRLGERRWMMVDVAQPDDEQLDKLCEALATLPSVDGLKLSEKLADKINEFRNATTQ